MPNTFFNLTKNEDLVDVWRERNPKSRDYSFYSERHKTWSRIDTVWVTKELDTVTEKVEILSSSISDHNPILWQMKDGLQGFWKWRLNEDILDKSEIVNNLKKDIKDYFDLNLSPNIKLSVVWDALKAVIRGRLIKWNIIERARKKEKSLQLQKELIDAEQQLKKKTGKKKLEKQLKIIKQQINILENQKNVMGSEKITAKVL